MPVVTAMRSTIELKRFDYCKVDEGAHARLGVASIRARAMLDGPKQSAAGTVGVLGYRGNRQYTYRILGFSGMYM